MKEKTALKLRKLLPKSFVKKVELVMLDVLETAYFFEAGLIGEQQAQEKMTGVLTKAMSEGLITKHNAMEFLELAQSPQGKVTYEFLKNKYKK